jgi:hypothetical protein
LASGVPGRLPGNSEGDPPIRAHPAAVDLLLIGSGLHFFSSDSLAMICTMP